jgi:tetratricopeptide (TPR) repeat protein
MKRFLGVLVALAVLMPMSAEAQKKNRFTRSAEVYLNNAAEEGVTADKMKLLEQALEQASESVRTEPGNALGFLMAGRAHMGLGHVAAADSAFDRAEELHPAYKEETRPYRLNAWIAAFNKGVTHIQAGETDAAIAAMEAANAVYDGRPEALTALGQLYLQKNDAQKAEQAFRAGLEILRGPARQGLSPEDEAKWLANEENAVLMLANLLGDSQRDAEAATLYEEFLKTHPDNASAKTNLGVVLMRAGKADEARQIFTDLMAREDLEDSQLFNIGVGLFRAEQFELAATAFERAVTAVPYSFDALYNYGQALYAYAAELEKARQPNDAAATRKLVETYTKMGEAAKRVLEIDPTNRNTYMMLAQAHRSLGELDPSTAEESKRAVLATLQEHEAVPFEVKNVQVTPGEGKYSVMGNIKNIKATAGTPLKINFQLVDKAGTVLGQQEITVTAPAAEESERFTAEITAPETVEHWKYVVVR